LSSRRKEKQSKEATKTPAKARQSVRPDKRTRLGEVIGLLIVGLSTLLFLSLYSYVSKGSNWIGPAGNAAAEIFIGALGYSSYIAVAGLGVLGLMILLGKEVRIKLWESTGYSLLALSVAGMLYIHAPQDKGLEFGGLAGMWIGKGLELAFAEIGATILLGLVALLALFMTTNFSLVRLLAAMMDFVILFIGRTHTLVLVHRERRRRLKEKKAELAEKKEEWLASENDSRSRRETLKAALEEDRNRKLDKVKAEVENKAAAMEEKERQKLLEELKKRSLQVKNDFSGKGDDKERQKISEEPVQVGGTGQDVNVSHVPRIVESPALKKSRRVAEQGRFKFEEFGDYQLPAVDLLDDVPETKIKREPQEMYDLARRVESKLADYGVQGKVMEIHPGPVVTMYEYKPGRGVRVSQIANLEKDLAMALEAKSVRIVAPIPGKSAVGIEVPNKERETVYLREIISSDEFTSKRGKLVFCLGKDIRGTPVAADIAKMPHLLIAGTTGSGKSVMLHSMLSSILFRASPDEVRMIIVDPKMVDMITYDGIPHLLLPVVTDMKKASQALAWAVEEMERRYTLLAEMGARNISTYNKRIRAMKNNSAKGDAPSAGITDRKAKKIIVLRRKEGESGQGPENEQTEAGRSSKQAILEASGMQDAAGGKDSAAELPEEQGGEQENDNNAFDAEIPQQLPYLLIIVDEFAELMALVSREVEMSIQRLAQKARAAGIHLVLATQRPDSKVITGVIKANFPSRIAFRVQDQTNSRVVLDQKGAESLLGMGDMLYLGPGSPTAKRCHGAFVSEDETQRLVEFLKEQGKPSYNEEILRPREDEDKGDSGREEVYDEKYDEAVRWVTESRKASISMLQRRLQVGYNRAARMIEMMEKEGIVSPPMGAKGREVLAPPPPE